MTHIPGLDKWLTTPPEDNVDDYEAWADKVERKMAAQWKDEMETVLRKMYDNCLSPIEAAKQLDEWQPEPIKPERFYFVVQLEHRNFGGGAWYMTSSYCYETFEEFVVHVPQDTSIVVAYTKVPERLKPLLDDDLPF